MESILDMLENAYLLSICVLNVAAFVAFWWDKRQSKENGWRIRERSLLFCCFNEFASSVLAMGIFRHKTQKWYFLIPLALGVIYWFHARQYLGEKVVALNWILVVLEFYNFYLMASEQTNSRNKTNYPPGNAYRSNASNLPTGTYQPFGKALI